MLGLRALGTSARAYLPGATVAVVQSGAEILVTSASVLVSQSGAEILVWKPAPAPSPPPPPAPVSSIIDPSITVFVNFQPSSTAPFQFQATLDRQIYTVIVTWNVWGQRYYLNVYTLNQDLIVAIPMVGSPLNYNINLVAGYFTNSMLVWRVQNEQFEIITPVPQ